MEIVSTNLLTETQFADIEALQKMCNDADGLKSDAFLSNEINFNKELPCFFLGYEENELIAFLTTFMPHSNEAEMIAFTKPTHRRQGCFTALLQVAMDMLKRAGIPKLFFVVEPDSKSGAQVLGKYPAATWERSEYRLIHFGKSELPLSPDLQLQLVSCENKEVCLKLCGEIFVIPKVENDRFIQNAIDMDNRSIYMVFLGQEPIGTFNLNVERDDTYIYGLGVSPDYRGKGFGKQLLGLALNVALSKSEKAILDVDTNNPHAYQLYIHNGFVVDFQTDYYALAVES